MESGISVKKNPRKIDFFSEKNPAIAWNLNFKMEKQPKNHF